MQCKVDKRRDDAYFTTDVPTHHSQLSGLPCFAFGSKDLVSSHSTYYLQSHCQNIFLFLGISIMSTSSDLPFSSINPIKCVGLNSTTPFCSLISEGKMIYTSGANILMQNTKTNQQKILFNNTFSGTIQLIHHHATLYNEHLLAIVIKDAITFMHLVVIVPLNPIIFNEQDKKDKCYTYYLKNVEEFQEIREIDFFDEGNFFGVVSQYRNLSNFSMMRTNTGQVIYQESYIDTKLSIRCVTLNKTNCASVLQHCKNQEIRLTLIVLDELSRKFYFNLYLEKDDNILEYFYECYQEECIMVALTNKGFIQIYKINEYEIVMMNRVDVRKGIKTNDGKGHKRVTSILDEKNYYFKPKTIQAASNKIIIAYEESCLIGVLFYSHYNPSNTKFTIIEQALANFTYVKQIKSISIATDNCSLGALIEIYPEKLQIIKDSQELQLSSQHIVASFSPLLDDSMNEPEEFVIADSNPMEICDESHNQLKEKHYIALQIDILSNMINHEEQAYSTDKTFSLCSGHNTVLKVEYCTYNNTMFLLMKNKMLKYYDLTPKEVTSKLKKSVALYKDFKLDGLLLWQKMLTAQPHYMTVHPFNFTILLIYEDLLKFHYFNIKNLFPAFIITSIKNCSLAKYSPLGDKIIIANNGSVIVLNSYTFQVMKTVTLPNILTQSQFKRVSNVRQKVSVSINPKLITDFQFLKNGDLVVFSGHSTFSLILDHDMTSHFGFLDLNVKQKFPQMVHDSINHLIILLQEEDILVLAKSNINTKNRCQVISKIEIAATSAYLLAEIGVLLVGGRDGVLHMLKWPDYCQEELYMRTTNKFHQFREPIVSIKVSANLSYIYTVSKSGAFCISELQVNQQDDKLSSEVKHLLLKASEIPIRQANRWLISRTDQQRKERQIVKLRGQEAEKISSNIQIIKKQEEYQQKQIIFKKAEFEISYARELKEYEQELGLQKQLQATTMLKDQMKIFQRKKKRKIDEISEDKEEKMKKIFEERTKLQGKFLEKQEQNKRQLDRVKDLYKRQMEELLVSLETDQKQLGKLESIKLKEERQRQQGINCDISHLEEDHFQDLAILNLQHKQQYNELLEINQSILSKNRSKNIEIHDYSDKIFELNQEKEKLQFDMFKVINESQQYEALKEKLNAENEHHKKIYDRLIKVSNQLEDKVIFERREQKKYEYKINKLEEEVLELCEQERKMSEKKAQVNEDFIKQRELNAQKANLIIDLNKKLQVLKDSKKQKHYQNCLLKNHYQQIVKTFMRNLQIDEAKAAVEICESYRSPTYQKKKQSIRTTQFEILKVQHDKLAQDATKWKEVKESYMNAFYKNHRKLDQQNLKLTYRYNDLLRLSQEYKVQISHLQASIEKYQKPSNDWKSLPKVPEARQTQSRLRPNFSFLHQQKKEKQNNKHLKKKLICLSLHQQTGKFITQA